MLKLSYYTLSALLYVSNLIAQITWTPLNEGLADLNIDCLTISSKNSKKMYAGTRSGLFISSDGGASWKLYNTGFSNIEISEIVIDPIDPQVLYICTHTKGVLKSTNGAKNWYETNRGLPTHNVPTSINAAKSSILYANPDGFGIYKSNNGGNDWRSVGRGRDVRNFVIDPGNSHIAYAATVQSILRTSDDGETWSTVGLTLPNPFINGLCPAQQAANFNYKITNVTIQV